jgi:hypothetical protein
VYLLVFHAYINEMLGSRSKIAKKENFVTQLCAEGFNSGVKGLINEILWAHTGKIYFKQPVSRRRTFMLLETNCLRHISMVCTSTLEASYEHRPTRKIDSEIKRSVADISYFFDVVCQGGSCELVQVRK